MHNPFCVPSDERERRQGIPNLDGILQTNSCGFSLAPWTFPVIRSKITPIKEVSLAAVKLKSQAS